MEGKQVDVHPQGVYYFCPHCKSHMYIGYKSSYCPDCGGKLLWNDVREFNEIISKECYYEDTDDRCKLYGSCNGSEKCEFVLHNAHLKNYAGRLTNYEKRQILNKKGW